MIFVTVGTHEQPFDRLIKKIDELKKQNIIKDEVIIQSGFSTYVPQCCTCKKLFPYNKMMENVKNARIVITHGGPSSFIMPLQEGKIPIVVPRQKKFGEHVNDHQVEFSKAVETKQNNIIVVTEIDNLEDIILNYDVIVKDMNNKQKSNNADFNKELTEIINKMFN